MSRYRGAVLRITRRLGELPGLTRKSTKRNSRPGQHGDQSRKPSEYAIRLEEKQKLRVQLRCNRETTSKICERR